MTRTKAYFFVSEELTEDTKCPLVFTNESHQVVEDIQSCQIETLLETIGECPLIILIPQRLTTLHRVTLPLLNEKKAQAAIPFAIEDQSAQEVSELHFAYDRQFYKNGQYLVLSCDKSWLKNLITLLDKYQLKPLHITTAWFALSDNQCALHEQSLLCRSETINGAIPLSIWPLVKNSFQANESLSIIRFDDESDTPSELNAQTTASQKSWEVWVAERLCHSNLIGLNQGAFATSKDQPSLHRSLWLLGGSITIWFIIWLSTSLFSLHHINTEIKQVDDKIAVIYRQFFPGARQIISPRFRITQTLKNQGAGEETALLTLLDQLAIPLKENRVTPIQMSYQNQRITLKLETNNFNHLDKFMKALKHQSVKAKQIDANRNEDKVEATVELQL